MGSREGNDEKERSEEQRLVDRLAAYDDAIAAGRTPEGDHSGPEDSERERRMEELRACVWLVRRVLPRESEDDASITEFEGSWPAPAEEPEGDQRLPERFGRFEIVRELGRGGFGVVFLAIDPVLNRQVALKLPQLGVLGLAEGNRRSLREAQTAAGLDHPNLVPVFEAGQVGPVPYITSAYCEGDNLGAWLRHREEPVPARLGVWLTAVLADAVQHAHDRGILHRDLKPGNVLMLRQDRAAAQDHAEAEPEWIPRITDFGLATLVDSPEDDTLSGLLIGSPPYMAPEQAAGQRRALSPMTDVYALGAILYELLTGRPPHRGETPLETIQRVMKEAPVAPRELRSNVPRDLETMILKCLEKEPEQRYESARALSEDLRRFLGGEPVRARRDGPVSRARRWAMNPRRTRDAGTLAMVFSGLLTTWSLIGIGLAAAGVGLHPPRPGDYIASCVQILVVDLIPAFLLGLWVRQGKFRALCVGTAFTMVRFVYQAASLDRAEPDFGGLYEDPQLRLVVFALIMLTTASVLLLHLIALLGWMLRHQDGSGGQVGGRVPGI